MGIQVKDIEYKDGETTFDAHVAWDDAISGPRPGVLVSHAWGGRSDFEDRKAELLAELGYVGFAIDLYGNGRRGASPDENRALMQPLLDDRAELARRLALALDQLRAVPHVESARTGAIGFCFGGLCVLDLVRSGANVCGVVSFHGLLGAPEPAPQAGADSDARVLVLHGWQDPLATPDNVLEFAREMDGRGVDWQLYAYGGAAHAFTNPSAADAEHGLMYDELADRRSWDAMQLFLKEIFAA